MKHDEKSEQCPLTERRTSVRSGQRYLEMKKTYLILSTLAALITLAHLIYWADALGFMLGTLFIIGIPILFWFPLSIISFVWAIFLKEEKKKLKAILLGIPIITLFLFYTIGEYYGP